MSSLAKQICPLVLWGIGFVVIAMGSALLGSHVIPNWAAPIFIVAGAIVMMYSFTKW